MLKYDKLVVTSGPYKFILLRLKIFNKHKSKNVDFTEILCKYLTV